MAVAFEEIMAFHPDNVNVYEEIRSNLNQLLPFVGAGLTAKVYGTWGDALKTLAGMVADDNTRNAIIEEADKDYLEAAQRLEDVRRPLNLERDLKRYFSIKKLDDGWDEIQSEAIWLLPDLFTCPVLTTNFDGTIERVYGQRGVSSFPTLDPTNAQLRDKAIRFRNTPCVFKLHGTVSNGLTSYASLVLTKKQYDRLYGLTEGEEEGDVRQALRAFIQARSMLFLGCSLKKDKTVSVMREVAEQSAVHYAITNCSKSERDNRVGELADAGICAILYEDDKHESVRVILEHLIEDRRDRGRRIVDPTNSEGIALRSNEVSSPEDESTAIIARINERLARQRASHASFSPMNNKPSEQLLPRGKAEDKYIPNARRLVKPDGGEEVSFREFLRKSWSEESQTHLLITGRSGVGKTVALLTFATEKDFLPKDVPVIYIPLYDLSHHHKERFKCVDAYLDNCFNQEERRLIEGRARDSWKKGPNIILLMDGYNEVPVARRRHVDLGIRHWASKPGTQIVTTSRVAGIFGLTNTRWLELQGFTKNEAWIYLGERSINPPNDERMWQVLRTPLMLRLYTDIESLSVQPRRYQRMEPSDSTGHLVWNYLQCELCRCVEQSGGGFTRGEYAGALLLTLPYVCWRMESAHELKVETTMLRYYVLEACERWHKKDKPGWFMEVEEGLQDGENGYYSHADERTTCGNQISILVDESVLLRESGDGYSLLHQTLRDGLAAIHLKNVMETSYENLPYELERPISENVKDLLAEICKSNSLLELWEANRGMRHTDAVTTHNILRIFHKKCDGDLTALNWSGMDIRGISLYPFRSADQLAISTDAALYTNTKMNADCFIPQGHASGVNSINYSPNGSLLASGSSDGTVRLWDPLTGRQVGAPLEGHEDWVRSVCFSPNGALLASGSSDSTVRLWNPSTGKQVVAPLEGHEDWVRSVCFSPDGKLLASGSSDSTVRLWNPSTGKQVGEPLRGHSGKVRSVCFSPDGLLIASASSDRTVRLWDSHSNLQIGDPLVGHQERIRSVRFSPDGKMLVSGSDDGTIRLWDLATGKEAGKLVGGHQDRIRSVCFSNDGRLIASGSSDGSIALWDTVTRNRIGHKFEGHRGKVLTLSFSSDDELLASGSEDGTIRQWDVATGREVGKPLEGHRIRIRSVCFSPDGASLASGLSDGSIRLWDPSTGQRIGKPLEGHAGRVRCVCFSPTNNGLLASCSSDQTIKLWNSTSGDINKTCRGHAGRVRSICFSPSGNLLASGSDDRTIRLWNPETGIQEGMPFKGHSDRVRSVCFSPDGLLIASASSDCTVRLWNTSTGEEVVDPLEGHRNAVRSVCFSPDGTLLASGSSDFTVRMWDPSTGRQVGAPLEGHKGRVRCVCFSPDGSLIASGSDDRTVRLWDVNTSEQICELPGGHRDWIRCVCFSPDGTLLASGSYDRTIRLWGVNDKVMTNVNASEVKCVRILEPPLGVDLHGFDFSEADIEDEHDRDVLRQNGAIVKADGF